MSHLGTCLLVGSLFSIGAPVPREPAPNPLERGYMGIEVQPRSLIIDRVQPGKAAEKAGLRAQDVIVRVGSLHPQAFEQVITHVCSFRPGVVLEIEVLRNNEHKVFQVKLGSRPPELDFPDLEEVVPVIP